MVLGLLFKSKNSENVDKFHCERNWYYDRYNTILIQRNTIFIAMVASLCSVGVSLFIAYAVVRSKTVDPFVIEVVKKSGIVTVVDPVTVKQYSSNQLLNEYFLINYIRAREVFNQYTYRYNYYTEVRLFSTKDTYRRFLFLIRRDQPNSPLNLYGGKVTDSKFKVRSILFLKPDVVEIRFSLDMYEDKRSFHKDKIAVIKFGYSSLKMNPDERYVNPLGFQVMSYRVNDEFL